MSKRLNPELLPDSRKNRFAREAKVNEIQPGEVYARAPVETSEAAAQLGELVYATPVSGPPAGLSAQIGV